MKKFIYAGMAMMLAVSTAFVPQAKADIHTVIAGTVASVCELVIVKTFVKGNFRYTVFHNPCTGETTVNRVYIGGTSIGDERCPAGSDPDSGKCYRHGEEPGGY